nr:MAG TPA: hypothetical protein [Caudoviricetes sp.]
MVQLLLIYRSHWRSLYKIYPCWLVQITRFIIIIA